MKKIAFFLVITMLFGIGCELKKITAVPDDTAIREKINELWTAKKENRWENAYQLYCESYRQKKSQTDYIKSSNLDIDGFSIVSIDPSENRESAEVVVSFSSKVFGIEVKSIQVREKWVKEGKQWYACPAKTGAKSLFE